MLIDTHAHICDSCYDERLDDMMSSLSDDNIEKVFAVGFDEESSAKSVMLAHKYKEVYAIVGVHPEEANKYNNDVENHIRVLAQDDRVIAIGEIGLDYHFDDSPSKEKQKKVLISQIKLAHEYHLPICIHLRDACGDLIDVLREYKDYLCGGVIHCYSESFESYEIFRSLGFKVAFGGTITFKNATRLAEVAKKIPLEDIILETDCPWLAPVPYRGTTNEPKYVSLVADRLAELKGIGYKQVIDITTKNVYDCFPKLKGVK